VELKDLSFKGHYILALVKLNTRVVIVKIVAMVIAIKQINLGLVVMLMVYCRLLYYTL